MRLIRTALLLGLAAWFLPSPPPGGEAERQAAGADGATIALAAVRAATDAATFCDRQPEVCDTALKAWDVLRAKLVYSAGLAFEEWRRRNAGASDASPPAVSTETGVSTDRPEAAGDPSAVPAPEEGDIGRLLRGAAADPLVTGSVTVAWNRNAGDGGDGSENTLQIRDLTVPWNGPKGG